MDADVKEFLEQSNAIEGVYDMDSLQQATFAWEYLKDVPLLNVNVIKKTHKILMLLDTHLMPNQKGYFRKIDVWVGGDKGHSPLIIQSEIKTWCAGANALLHDPQYMHVLDERIHPFVDGNGRTGRMFLNWMRLRQGLPILVIKEKEKQAYYEWFRK